jgi:hypothetical protein
MVPSTDGKTRVEARCVDLPVGTIVTVGQLTAPQSGTNSQVITSGPGVKACALTSITGPLASYTFTNGIFMTPPSQLDGNWTLTVTHSKTAHWACVQ